MIIHPNDSVIIALEPIPAGTKVDEGIITLEAIPAGHKIARRDIAVGESVIKYGFPIGHATMPISAGAWIHSQNLSTNLSGTLEYEYHPTHFTLPDAETSSFMGYERTDGQVGIRNEVWILPTVGCVNKTAE